MFATLDPQQPSNMLFEGLIQPKMASFASSAAIEVTRAPLLLSEVPHASPSCQSPAVQPCHDRVFSLDLSLEAPERADISVDVQRLGQIQQPAFGSALPESPEKMSPPEQEHNQWAPSKVSN